jgi:long-chain acyl-CoA synthetase
MTRENKYLPKTRFNNLPEMIVASKNKYFKKPAIRWIRKADNTVESISYDELIDSVKAVFYALKQMGFKKEDRIGICSENRTEWILADFGIQSLGAITVALYPSLKPEEIKYIVNDAGCKAIFVDTRENLEKVKTIIHEAPSLKVIIIFDPKRYTMNDAHLMTFKDLLSLGVEHYYSSNAFSYSLSEIQEEDLASIIYTSGTTGVPKGVMLTHKNFLSDVLASVSVAMTLKKGIKPWEHRFLSILPFSHSFGRCVGEYCPLLVGATLDIVSELNPDTIRTSFELFEPTIMAGIPYLYQKIYEIVLEELSSYPNFVKNLVEGVIENGKLYYENKRNDVKNTLRCRLKHNILGKVVGKRIINKLGGNLELMISGSAAISKDLIYFFNTINIPLIEGYGLTEASPVTHLTRTEDNSDFRPNFDRKIEVCKKIGSVGPPIEIPENPYKNIEQRVDPTTNELLIRGPMVMKGYWNKPQHTNEALDEDGWLHTGDVVEIDEDGYVSIKGRAKLIIKLATGKMISPAAIENLITPTSRIIAQFLVVGDDSRKYLTAIVVPYQQPLKDYADKEGIAYETWADLIKNRKILARIKEEVDELTKDVSDYMRPKKFLISSEALTSEKYVTPTYKFKRKAIYLDFGAEIDALYNSDNDFFIMEKRLTDFYEQEMIIT